MPAITASDPILAQTIPLRTRSRFGFEGIRRTAKRITGTATPLASADFAGVIRNNTDGGAGVLALTKAGAGTQILSAANLYTGANAGTLTIASGGSLAASSPVTVNNTATFNVNGTAGDVTVNNCGTLSGAGTVDTVTFAGTTTVSPGNSPGILNTGSITTSSGTTFNFELTGPAPGTGHDQIRTTGTIALDGTLVVSLTYLPAVNDVVFLWLNDSNEPISGTFTGLPEGSSIPAPGGSFTISYAGNGDSGPGGNDIGLTWIPEPSSAMLAAVAALLGLRRRRAA